MADKSSDALPEVTDDVVGSEVAKDAETREEGLDFVMDVPLRLSVEIGGTEMLVRDVVALNKGSIVELDRLSGELVDVFVNERLVAKGEITAVDDRMAVRIVEVVAAEPKMRQRR